MAKLQARWKDRSYPLMKKVIIIGADFAPSSLPPATRIRFFANHLPEFGWEPVVLTVDPQYYDWPVDWDNLKLLSTSLQIVRTEAWRSSWTRKLGVGDIGMRSLWHQWQALKRLCRETKVDLILIPVPPYVPMILGRLAHRRFGIPYVVDYIDPWVTDTYGKLPRSQRPPKWFLADKLARLLEPFALKQVSRITGVSQGTTDSVAERYQWLTKAGATEIPYGAETGDFAYLREHPRQNNIFDRADGFIHLVYVGACIPSMHPTVRALFQAIGLGLVRQPDEFGRLRLHFVGTSSATNGVAVRDVVALAREAGIENQVDERPTRVPYLDSLQLMLDSDGLFLLGSNEPHYTASKVFPYILSRRPLLAIFHEASSVVRILQQTSAGVVVTFNSVESPTRKIEEIFDHLTEILKGQNKSQVKTNWQAVDQYTTAAMSARLAACMLEAANLP
jgi:hypothetical protein